MIDLATNLARRFAPHLVRRIAGERAGDVAQRVLDIAAGVTGATAPEDIEARLEADTELAHAFRVKAAELDADLEKAYLEDRQDARNREVEMAKLGKSDFVMQSIAVIVTLGFFTTLIIALSVDDLSADQKDVVMMMLGMLSTAFAAIIAYYFGSSRGSAMKNALLGGGGNGQSRR